MSGRRSIEPLREEMENLEEQARAILLGTRETITTSTGVRFLVPDRLYGLYTRGVLTSPKVASQGKVLISIRITARRHVRSS